MVDLKATSFDLGDEDISWVEETIGSMTLEEKVGKLFVGNATPGADQTNRDLVEKYHIGGTRYTPASASAVYALNSFMQENSNIPLLMASIFEAGGNGCCAEGTLVAPGVQCGAANNPAVAYDRGYVGAVESAALGCNWCFTPIVDIAEPLNRCPDGENVCQYLCADAGCVPDCFGEDHGAVPLHGGYAENIFCDAWDTRL